MELLTIFEEFDPTIKKNDASFNKLVETVKFLETKKKILFLTTSNRGEWVIKNLKEEPKSTKLAKTIQSYLGRKKCTLIEVPKLKIYPCEGNVSNLEGNGCGIKKAILKNKTKNPSGNHRCWRSINNPDDELWKISKELFESDCVVFFGSVRWGQMNSEYQKLIERLCWIENRHTTLKESNVVKDICAGIILTGQNWNGENVIETQKQVLKFYGFDVRNEICWNWQYTNKITDESEKSYKDAFPAFVKKFDLDNLY